MCGSLLRPWPAWPLYPYWQSRTPRPYHLSTLNSGFQNNNINTCSVTWAEWNNVELRVWPCSIRRRGALSACNTRTSKDGDRKMEWTVPTEEIVEFHLPLLLPVDHFHMLVYLLLAAVSCFVPFHSDPCYYTLQLLLCEHTAEREGTQSELCRTHSLSEHNRSTLFQRGPQIVPLGLYQKWSMFTIFRNIIWKLNFSKL